MTQLDCQRNQKLDVGDMLSACVQLEPSGHALVGAVVPSTLTTIIKPRSATLETSTSATVDTSTLVFAPTTSTDTFHRRRHDGELHIKCWNSNYATFSSSCSGSEDASEYWLTPAVSPFFVELFRQDVDFVQEGIKK